MKRFIICLIIAILFVMGISFFKYKTKATECWWGVMYPQLSYVVFEDTDNTRISALDTEYIYLSDTTIKTEFFIIEWLKEVFNFSP